MVSSGIPISNPQHASELADMALTLCHDVTKFRVGSNVFQLCNEYDLYYSCETYDVVEDVNRKSLWHVCILIKKMY